MISIVRRRGKKIEDDIFSQGENMPTHRAIEDTEFLEEIGIEPSIIELLPSKNNTEATVRFIINQTRNSKEFPIVFDTLCRYGFYRNTYGVRNYIYITTLTIGIASVLLWSMGLMQNVRTFTIWSFLFIDVLLVIFIRLTVTKKTVIQSANDYAKALIRAGVNLS